MTGYRQRVILIAVYDERGKFIYETEGVHIEERRTRAAARIRERKRKEKMIRQKIALVIAIVTVSIILAAFMPWRGTADTPASYRQVKQDTSAGAGEEVRQTTAVILPSSGTAAGYIPDAAEVEALAKMLYGEARGIPSDTEKAACVWVVLNRVADPRFPDTVLEVLEAPYQFAGYSKDYGLDRLREFMRRFYRKNGVDGWVLKCDISKYFYTIRHDVLKTLIRAKISDPDVLWLVDLIIDSTEGNVGIPIGNQTSQLFALLYLDGLDHFIKEKLGIKYYGRYMDDFFLIHHDKAYLQECRKQIEEFVQRRGLSLNAKTNIFPLKNGVDFLGFHTYLTDSGAVIRKVRRRSKNNMKRKLKKFAALRAAGKIDDKTIEQSYQSWRGHAAKGNSYHLIRRTDHYYNSLIKPKEAAKCQKH